MSGVAPSHPERHPLIPLLVIVAVAIALRFLLIGREGLWLDEAASWFMASGDLQRALKAEPTNPPLYYTMLFFWISWLGPGEAAMRSLSVLPSVAGVVVTWLIGRRLISVQAGLIAAGYQAISTFHIYYAQEVRGFALLSFLLSLSFLALIEWLREHEQSGRNRYLYGYIALATLSLYTHFIATFFLALHALYVLICYRRTPRVIVSYAAAGVAVVVAFLPWLIQILRSAGASGQSRRHLLMKIPQTYFSFLFGDRLIPLDAYAVEHMRETLIQHAPELVGALVVTAALSWFAIQALSRLPLKQWLPMPLLAVGPVVFCIAIWNKVQLFDERYLIAASPFVYLFIASGAVTMWSAARTRSARLLAATVTSGFVALLVLAGWNYYFSPRYGREQWREAIGWLNSQVASGGRSLVILDPMYLHYPYDYYKGRHAVDTLLLTDPVRKEFLSSSDSARKAIAGYEKVWLVRSHQPDDGAIRVLRSIMRQSGVRLFPKSNRIEIFEFSGPLR